MLTGDASINPTAPVVCATAEIVANMALRTGAATDIDQVVMDEFHFYGDPDRGWAWQVPLLELTRAQFVLMSATLGDMSTIERASLRRTGRPVAVVRSADATGPAPLRVPPHAAQRDDRVAPRRRPGAALRRPLHPGAGAHPRPGAHLGPGDDALGAGRDRVRARGLPLRAGLRQNPLAPFPPRHRRPSRRDAPQVPPTRRAAHEGRPAPCRRRDRHPRRRGQPARCAPSCSPVLPSTTARSRDC